MNWRTELVGFGLGVLAAIGLAVGLEVYNAIEAAPDAALLDLGFWKNVGLGALVTGVRSGATTVVTLLGRRVPGVSQP